MNKKNYFFSAKSTNFRPLIFTVCRNNFYFLNLLKLTRFLIWTRIARWLILNFTFILRFLWNFHWKVLLFEFVDLATLIWAETWPSVDLRPSSADNEEFWSTKQKQRATMSIGFKIHSKTLWFSSLVDIVVCVVFALYSRFNKLSSRDPWVIFHKKIFCDSLCEWRSG